VKVYADSSVVASVYLLDVHMPAAIQLLSARPDIWLTPFHEAEFAHVLSQGVFSGRFSQQQASRTHLSFENDRDAGFWHRVPFPVQAFEACALLARRYGARIGSRTLDALHVACAIELKAERFWTFDERQKKLAKTAGLKTN